MIVVKLKVGDMLLEYCLRSDVSFSLHEIMDLVVGEKYYTQTLDYLNFPFQCVRCHKYGHILSDCGKPFIRKVLKKKVDHVPKKVLGGGNYEVSHLGLDSQVRKEDASDIGGKLEKVLAVEVNSEVSGVMVGDISIPLLSGIPTNDDQLVESLVGMDHFDFSNTQLHAFKKLWNVGLV